MVGCIRDFEDYEQELLEAEAYKKKEEGKEEDEKNYVRKQEGEDEDQRGKGDCVEDILEVERGEGEDSVGFEDFVGMGVVVVVDIEDVGHGDWKDEEEEGIGVEKDGVEVDNRASTLEDKVVVDGIGGEHCSYNCSMYHHQKKMDCHQFQKLDYIHRYYCFVVGVGVAVVETD